MTNPKIGRGGAPKNASPKNWIQSANGRNMDPSWQLNPWVPGSENLFVVAMTELRSVQ